MPVTAPIALLFLIAAALGVGALVRRSRRLGYMALTALTLGLLLTALLAWGIRGM